MPYGRVPAGMVAVTVNRLAALKHHGGSVTLRVALAVDHWWVARELRQLSARDHGT
jgi:hypothetical protein